MHHDVSNVVYTSAKGIEFYDDANLHPRRYLAFLDSLARSFRYFEHKADVHTVCLLAHPFTTVLHHLPP